METSSATRIGSWTEEQEKLILATLDPIAGMAEADVVALAELLEGIESDDERIAALLASIGEGEIGIQQL